MIFDDWFLLLFEIVSCIVLLIVVIIGIVALILLTQLLLSEIKEYFI